MRRVFLKKSFSFAFFDKIFSLKWQRKITEKKKTEKKRLNFLFFLISSCPIILYKIQLMTNIVYFFYFFKMCFSFVHIDQK